MTNIHDSIDVGPCWAGHPVGFCLLTHGGIQYVAYYDDERRLVVAHRSLQDRTWGFTHLPVTTNWDSHRYVACAVDGTNHLHVAADMHNSPLTYFRGDLAGDPGSLQRIDVMTGQDEARCTYPRFFRGPEDELMFTYRSGSSGQGQQFINYYDEETRTWRRLFAGALIAGEGKRGVYVDRFRPIRRDAEGWYHVCWVWRGTSDASTTHDPSYMRTRDWRTWERSDGQPLDLPVTHATAEIVDHVPSGSGLINGNVCVGVDAEARPIVSYHKFDTNGLTQLFNARREHAGWQVHQSSAWDYRWEFGGGGTIPFAIRIGPVQTEEDGTLSQATQHCRHGTARPLLESDSLRVTGPAREPPLPAPRDAQRNHILGLVTNHAEDSDTDGEKGVRNLLQWDTFPANRDHGQDDELPFAATLRVLQSSDRPAHLTGYSDVQCKEHASFVGKH